MKKNIKYLLISVLMLLIVPINVYADEYSCDPDESINVVLGETFSITCGKSIDNKNACKGRAALNDTGFCRNSEKSMTFENTADFTWTISRPQYQDATYTFTPQNIGYNYFFCDETFGNKCYFINVTDSEGRTYTDINGSNSTTPLRTGGLYEKRSGYGCYLMCRDTSCNTKFLFYTNRDMSGITGFNGTTARTNVFMTGNDERSIKNLYEEHRTEIANMAVHSFIEGSDFINYESGSAMSPMQCAGAGAVFTATGSSEPYELVIEETSPTDDAYNGQKGVFEVLPRLLLFGTDFTVITPFEDVVNSDDPYDYANGDAQAIRRGSTLYPNSSDALEANTCTNQSYLDIHTENDFIHCYQCTGSSDQLQNSGSTCNNGYYTIGVLPEPDNVQTEIDDGTNPNDLPDGQVVDMDGDGETAPLTCSDIEHVTYVYIALRILAPFLLILFGSIDFFKAIYAADEKKQKEARAKFPRRLIAFLLLLVLPAVLHIIFNSIGTGGAEQTSLLCCVITNGSSSCSYGSGSTNNSSSNNNNNNNNSYRTDLTTDNMVGGNNYVSPIERTTTASVDKCFNDYYGECISGSIDTIKKTCTCKYVARNNITEELCNSDGCSVGYKNNTCYYHARLGETSNTLSNINVSSIPSCSVHVSGSEDVQDKYYYYNFTANMNTSKESCESSDGKAYCGNTNNNCICIKGASIYN